MSQKMHKSKRGSRPPLLGSAGIALLCVGLAACATTNSKTSPMVAALNEPRALTPTPATTIEGRAAVARAAKPPKGTSERDTLITQARLALARRDAKGADELAHRVLRVDYRDRAAKLVLAAAAMIGGRQEDARALLQLLGGAKAPEAEALNLLGIIAWEDGDAISAEALFARAVAGSPTDVGARMNLGLVLLRRNSVESAEQQFREVLKRAPGNPDARRHLAIVLSRRGKLDDAEGQYKKIDGWRDSARILQDLAILYKRSGRLDDAVDALSRAIETPRLPLYQHDAMVALLEEIRAERAARDPQNVEDVDALIAQAKKGRPTDDSPPPSYFMSETGTEAGH